MEFLKKLSEAPLPVSICQTELIDQVRSYVSAGLVTADSPSELKAHFQIQGPAHVPKITTEGKRVLGKYFKCPGWC
jgi:hypothetical protein